MTKEDKLYIGGGVALALTGLGFWYFNKLKKDNLANSNDTIDIPFEEVTNPKPTKPTKSTPPLLEESVVVDPEKVITEPEKFYLPVGQEVMSNSVSGTKTYQVKRNADGSYSTNGKTQATILFGDKIGKIIWVGKRPDGTYRYVIERNGNFINTLHWVASTNAIKAIGKILPVKQPAISKGLVLTRILHKGIYNSPEVKELQKRLGLVADGDFGANTEKALLAKKKVKQIRLADWK